MFIFLSSYSFSNTAAVSDGAIAAGQQYVQYTADQGHMGSLRTMGHLCYFGARGVARDPARAARYFAAAAELGDTHSMVQLGEMHTTGTGVRLDVNASLRYFRRAAREVQPPPQRRGSVVYVIVRGSVVWLLLPKDMEFSLKPESGWVQ